jgi:type IV pilus secretin PilQ/predicted competence protein
VDHSWGRSHRAIAVTLILGLGALIAGEGPARSQTSAPPSASPDTSTKLISLDAEDAVLSNVLKILGEKGNLNIITGPGVTPGRISIHMKDVPVDQAVNLVVRAAGLAYERIGNSVVVADAQSLKEETGLSSYVIGLKYANAEDVQGALRGLAAQVDLDRGGNRLVIVTSPRVISEIQEIVRIMDVPSREVSLEARIVEVSTSDAKKLGVDWDQLNRQTFVIIEGEPHGASKIGEYPDSIGWFGKPPGKNLFTPRPLYRQGYAWKVALDLLISEGHARVLASPKIATLNGHEASILIGSRIPYVTTGTVFAGGAAAPTTQIEKEEVGVKLRITPLINPDGFITTHIAPEVSSIVDFRGPNNDLPVVSTREASTTVRIKDGSSVIIGGLLSEERGSQVTKVPLLGSLPLLGKLFQHQSSTVEKHDLVIEVTPHIIAAQP